MVDGSRAVPPRSQTNCCYHSNYRELVGKLCGWTSISIHSGLHTHTYTHAHNNSPSTSHYGDLLPPQAFLYPYGTVVFIVSGALSWVYLFIYLPETKGRSIDDITMEFRNRTRTREIKIDPACRLK